VLCNIVFRTVSQDCYSDEMNVGEQTSSLKDCLADPLITCIPVGVCSIYISAFTSRNKFLRPPRRVAGKCHVEVLIHYSTGYVALMKAFSESFF
jgi:hypothetical protein